MPPLNSSTRRGRHPPGADVTLSDQCEARRPRPIPFRPLDLNSPLFSQGKKSQRVWLSAFLPSGDDVGMG